MCVSKIGRLFIATGLTLAFGLPAQAQLEEIVVTARKTSENL
jgi:hypothetical protein